MKQIAHRNVGYFIGEGNIAGGTEGSVTKQIEDLQNDFQQYLTEKSVPSEDAAEARGDEVNLDDVVVEMYRITLDFGMKRGNPMNHVYLYSKELDVPVLASKLGGNYVKDNSPQKIMESNMESSLLEEKFLPYVKIFFL